MYSIFFLNSLDLLARCVGYIGQRHRRNNQIKNKECRQFKDFRSISDSINELLFVAKFSLISMLAPYVTLLLQRTRSIYADLRHLNAHRCAMCLVLGKGGGSKIDDTLVDKSAILTTKNIISLQLMENKIAKIGGWYYGHDRCTNLWSFVPISTSNTKLNSNFFKSEFHLSCDQSTRFYGKPS